MERPWSLHFCFIFNAMKLLQSNNPVLTSLGKMGADSSHGRMTTGGAIFKTMLALAFLVAVAWATWEYSYKITYFKPVWIGSGIAAFVTAFLLVYRKQWAWFLIFFYATFKGIFLGGISMNYHAQFKGLVVLAVILTVCVLFIMLMLYQFRIIKVTKRLRSVIITTTSVLVVIFMISFVLRMLDLPPIPYIHDSGYIGIAFSSFVVVIAALNFLLDFKFLDKGAGRYPKYMEWYGAFGLLVTIVWQYFSILRLLRKLTRFKNSW